MKIGSNNTYQDKVVKREDERSREFQIFRNRIASDGKIMK